MSVIGRLARRAPAWRLCLAAALACTGLAAMFPPTLPPLTWPRSTTAATAHYRPDRTMPPARGGMVQVTSDAPDLQGLVPFAGRQLPLPAGRWHELAIDRRGGPIQLQSQMLARIESGHLTGLIMLAAPGPVSGAVGSVGLPGICDNPNLIAREISPPASSADPLRHECWGLDMVNMSRAASDPDQEPLIHASLARLGDLGIVIPPTMLLLELAETDATGWQDVLVFLPGDMTRARATGDWANQFLPLIRQGFAGTLSTADLLPALLRDPA